jgi:hypothetical protein
VLHVSLAALALATTVLAASGCGRSSKPATTTAATSAPQTTSSTTVDAESTPTPTVAAVKPAVGKPLSRARWIAKGEAICTRLNAQLAARTVKSPTEFAVVLPQAAAYERAELAQLIKLVPPASEAGDWQKFLTETQQWAENSTKLGQIAQAGKFTLALPLVTTTRKLHEHLAHLASHKGFKECALV